MKPVRRAGKPVHWFSGAQARCADFPQKFGEIRNFGGIFGADAPDPSPDRRTGPVQPGAPVRCNRSGAPVRCSGAPDRARPSPTRTGNGNGSPPGVYIPNRNRNRWFWRFRNRFPFTPIRYRDPVLTSVKDSPKCYTLNSKR